MIAQAQENNDRRFDVIESRLNERNNSIYDKEADHSADDAEDRKRLKERLKEALNESKRTRPNSDNENEDWLEYMFGICQPDGRVGKGGSRCKPLKFPPISRLKLKLMLLPQANTSTLPLHARCALNPKTDGGYLCTYRLAGQVPQFGGDLNVPLSVVRCMQGCFSAALRCCSTRPSSCQCRFASGTTTTRAKPSRLSTLTSSLTPSSW
jgi:hypothetical protein